MKAADMKHVKDYGNVELFAVWMAFDGKMSLNDIKSMSPVELHDFRYCLEVYNELSQSYKK